MQRSRHLSSSDESSLEINNDERLAWEICSQSSAVFLKLLPDSIGYMEDLIFQVAIATHFGQACPLIEPVVGQRVLKRTNYV